jgi:hypothetical protein
MPEVSAYAAWILDECPVEGERRDAPDRPHRRRGGRSAERLGPADQDEDREHREQGATDSGQPSAPEMLQAHRAGALTRCQEAGGDQEPTEDEEENHPEAAAVEQAGRRPETIAKARWHDEPQLAQEHQHDRRAAQAVERWHPSECWHR